MDCRATRDSAPASPCLPLLRGMARPFDVSRGGDTVACFVASLGCATCDGATANAHLQSREPFGAERLGCISLSCSSHGDKSACASVQPSLRAQPEDWGTIAMHDA